MMRGLVLLLVAAVALSGCESIFGKEEGKRGSLPGKREDVFLRDRALQADAALKDSAVDIGPATDNADWVVAGGSLNHLMGALTLSDKPAEAWSSSVGAGSSHDSVLIAQPVVAGGRVFTIDAEGNVSAFAINNGNRVWQRQIPDPYPEDSVVAGAGLAVANGKVFATTSYGNVVALDAGSGKVLWQKVLPSPMRGGPIVVDDKVYVITTTNTTYELNGADGSVGWSHTGIQENASFIGMASPTATDELIISPYSSGEVFGLRRINGKLTWEENLSSNGLSLNGALPAMADIQGQPVLDGNKVYVASHSGRIVSIDVRSGRTTWETDVGSVQTPWVAGNSIFVVTIDGQLAALSREDGRIRWAQQLPRYPDPDNKTATEQWVGPVLAGGVLWVASSEGELKSFSPLNGKELSSRSLGSAIYVTPIVAGCTLYVLMDNGTLVALR